MKAVSITAIGRPLEDRETPLPSVGEGEVLVRVKAAGICHSDVHYRNGTSPVPHLPLTPGHEVAGVIEQVGPGVDNVKKGDRVCLHYLVTCGRCAYCVSGDEQFCPRGAMLGRHRDGGYAEFMAAPSINAVPLPDEISFEHGAVLMCSSATSLHALSKARLKPGETVAVFGVGGLGMSAVQLAKARGALDVFAVDINPAKLKWAEQHGAIPIDARQSDPVAAIKQMTGGRGVDVSVELIGLPRTMNQSVLALGPLGRTVLVGITDKPFLIDSYTELLGKEAEVIGSNDHLLRELPLLLEYCRRGMLDLSGIVIGSVGLEAEKINGIMDTLEEYKVDGRFVITP